MSSSRVWWVIGLWAAVGAGACIAQESLSTDSPVAELAPSDEASPLEEPRADRPAVGELLAMAELPRGGDGAEAGATTQGPTESEGGDDLAEDGRKKADAIAAWAEQEAQATADAEIEATEEESDDEVWVGPPDDIAACEDKLDAAGIEWTASRIPLHQTRSGIYCGASQIVRYRQGPGEIRWGGNPKVTCGVALALAQLEQIVQEEAERHFGRRVRRIEHMGTYNCREMANYPGWVSEHSYANAIDIKAFELTNGRTISVLAHYAKTGTEAKTARAKFLRAVARRLYDEGVFSVVLTPSFDRAHRNHFHLDMARYKVDGI